MNGKTSRSEFSSIMSKYIIEIEENKKMIIEGVNKITEYSDILIALRVGKSEIFIEGESLCINSYKNKSVSIEGNIYKIEFKN